MRDCVSKVYFIREESAPYWVAAILSIVVFISGYEGLSTYFHLSTKEIIQTWVFAEFVNLQQGNTLSSVDKLQRSIIGNSSLLRGVQVINDSGRILLTMGEIHGELLLKPSAEWELVEKKSGWFSYIYKLQAGSLAIIFFTEAAFLRWILIGLVSYVLLISFSFAVFVKRSAIQSQKLKSQIEIDAIKNKLLANQKVAAISRQVAHDIRSPLQALDIAIRYCQGLEDNAFSLIRNATDRIRSISNDLLLNSKDLNQQFLESENNVQPNSMSKGRGFFFLDQAILEIIEEKKLEYDGVKLNLCFSGIGNAVRAFGNRTHFQSILSNLINNSVEASRDGISRVSVSGKVVQGQVAIYVVDDGRGISNDLISKLGTVPISFGKETSLESGSGIGLYDAKKKVQSWGGDLHIFSDGRKGTTIEIKLPVNPN